MPAKIYPKKSWCIILGIGFVIGYIVHTENIFHAPYSVRPSPIINVCFSPEGKCEKMAINAIRSAEKEILVQCYSFTSKKIAAALMKAHEKGILVRVLFDKSQLNDSYSQIQNLTKFGIETKVDFVKGIAHNKTIIIDGDRLITGSYNFSNAANYRNAENMLYINDFPLAQTYRNQWLWRFRKIRIK